MISENIKRSEVLHFSQPHLQTEVLALTRERRAELVENALLFLYRVPTRQAREELLALILTSIGDDETIAELLTDVAYTVCNRHLTITSVNGAFLKRAGVEAEQILGKSLYYEREYEGTEIEQLYSMVMETRMTADTLVRYVGLGYDGWFVIVVIPLEGGGIGVLSRFSKDKNDFLPSELDLDSPEAPRLITKEVSPVSEDPEQEDEQEDQED